MNQNFQTMRKTLSVGFGFPAAIFQKGTKIKGCKLFNNHNTMKTYTVQFTNSKTGKNESDFVIRANSLKQAKKDAQLHKDNFKRCKTFVKLNRD